MCKCRRDDCDNKAEWCVGVVSHSHTRSDEMVCDYHKDSSVFNLLLQGYGFDTTPLWAVSIRREGDA